VHTCCKTHSRGCKSPARTRITEAGHRPCACLEPLCLSCRHIGLQLNTAGCWLLVGRASVLLWCPDAMGIMHAHHCQRHQQCKHGPAVAIITGCTHRLLGTAVPHSGCLSREPEVPTTPGRARGGPSQPVVCVVTQPKPQSCMVQQQADSTVRTQCTQLHALRCWQMQLGARCPQPPHGGCVDMYR
jgi:hypothetical protein